MKFAGMPWYGWLGLVILVLGIAVVVYTTLLVGPEETDEDREFLSHHNIGDL